MPRIETYKHRLSAYQSLLDLANIRLTEENYRTIVSGGSVGPIQVSSVFPDDPPDIITLWDRSHILAGQPVLRHGVAALQRLLRANLQLDIAGEDPRRRDPKRYFQLAGRKPFEGAKIGLSRRWATDDKGRTRRDSEGRPLEWRGLSIQDHEEDLHDFWYIRYLELYSAFQNPPRFIIAPFDRGPRLPLRHLIQCEHPRCHQILFKRTVRTRFCSRRCEKDFHKLRTGPSG